MSLLCIDPGLSASPGGTGWAYFNDDSLYPEKTGVMYSNRPTWEERSVHIVNQLVNLYTELDELQFRRIKCDVYIEFPKFFVSAKGMMCATGKDGDDSDLCKLAFHVGRLYEMATHMGFRTVNLIRVNEWKAQLKKPVVAQRIVSRIEHLAPYSLGIRGTKDEPIIYAIETGVDIISSHAIDAVGMGLYVKGKFKANTGTVSSTPASTFVIRKVSSGGIKGRNKQPRTYIE